MNAVAEIHPFDVMKLSKGDWIPPDRCEEVLGIRRDERRYQLRMLKLRDLVERQWRDMRDEEITVCIEKDGLRICTDDKAVEENRRRRLGHVRGLESALRRQGGVDRGKLSSPNLRDMHDREVVVGAAFLCGGRKEQRVALKAHRRSTPNLLPEKTRK